MKTIRNVQVRERFTRDAASTGSLLTTTTPEERRANERRVAARTQRDPGMVWDGNRVATGLRAVVDAYLSALPADVPTSARDEAVEQTAAYLTAMAGSGTAELNSPALLTDGARAQRAVDAAFGVHRVPSRPVGRESNGTVSISGINKANAAFYAKHAAGQFTGPKAGLR